MRADPVALLRSLLPQLAAAELAELLRFADSSDPAQTEGAAFIALLKRSDRSTAFKTAAGFVQSRRRAAQGNPGEARDAARLALAQLRELLTAQLVGRGDAEAEPPAGTTADPAANATPGPAAPQAAAHQPALPGAAPVPQLSDGEFVLLACERVLGRACRPQELRQWQLRLERRQTSRTDLLGTLFNAAQQEADAAQAHESSHDGRSFHVMGTGQPVTFADWQARAAAAAADNPPAAGAAPRAAFSPAGPPRPLITCITSLYRGGPFIARLLQNITTQTCFGPWAELIIVDADSPDGEQAVIAPYLARHANIRYLRINHRIGIYEAWNRAIELARGDYLTCTNVDDLRRPDSLERQAACLQSLPWVDVVYQDFFYTLDPAMDFEQVARVGIRSQLPLVTPHTLLACNPPHNAPMWRRRLHDELGPFDPQYQSAGDYEFWLRALAAGKRFYRLDDPHVVYFQNPAGLSTRPGTRGFAETRDILRRYGRRLMPAPLVEPFAQFCRRHTPAVPPNLDDGEQDRPRQVRRALRHAARTLKYDAARPLQEAA